MQKERINTKDNRYLTDNQNRKNISFCAYYLANMDVVKLELQDASRQAKAEEILRQFHLDEGVAKKITEVCGINTRYTKGVRIQWSTILLIGF